MRRIDFRVPIYDWDITIVTIYNEFCKEQVSELIDEFELPDREELLQLVGEGFNGGRTYAKTSSREIVVILFPWTSEIQFEKSSLV